MKNPKIAFSALIFCLTLLSGCQFVTKETAGELAEDFSKTEEITISDSATGETLAVLNGSDEIDAFCEALDNGGWHILDFEDIPPESERECVITMRQTETVKAGMDPKDAEMIQLCTLYTYRGSDCLVMEFPFASFPFTLTGPAAAYLHSFAK